MKSTTRKNRRQRGAVAIIVALLLPVLLAFAGMAVDVGHIYMVRNQLQNAADAASLAGARTLDGTVAQFVFARLAAQTFGNKHIADNSSMAMDLNVANAAEGDIVLGRWHSEGAPPYFESISDPTVSPQWINAVQTHTHRSTASGGAVQAWLAQMVGYNSTNVNATSVAVAGGPSKACSFPIAIPDCMIQSAGGTLLCGRTMTFKSNNTDTAGWTVLTPGPPVSSSGVTQMINDARNGVCNSTTSGAPIYLNNGNGIAQPAKAISDWIAANGGPITVTLPVIQSNMSSSSCNVTYNQAWIVAGFAKVTITAARYGADAGIDMTFDCNVTEDAPAGGSFFGDKATRIYITQ